MKTTVGGEWVSGAAKEAAGEKSRSTRRKLAIALLFADLRAI
jgi:hypothetical protein